MELRRLLLAILGLAAFAVAGHAAPPAAPLSLLSDADCGTLACRPAGTFEITFANGRSIPFPVAKSPYVATDGTIAIYPGETLVFDFPQAGDTPGLPRYLANPTGSETGVLTVSYKEESVGSNSMMMLNLRQTTGHSFKVDATVTYLNRDGMVPQHSSTCPLWPNVLGNEMWQQPLGPILIQNIRFLPPSGGSMNCD